MSNDLAAALWLQQRLSSFYHDRMHKLWQGQHIMRGRVPQTGDIQLISNDYLALAKHPHILNAQAQALLTDGNGSMMSDIFHHGLDGRMSLTEKFANFLQAEACIISQSGWCANTGLVQSIADKDTPVYIDMMAHMSLWEGIRAAGAQAIPFRHNDANHLQRQVEKYGQGIVIVDSVYSTNGSVCPLTDIVMVAEKYHCLIIVDESHSLGTHGKYGEGMVADLGLSERVHFRTASLAKAFVGRGGIITCAKKFVDYFKFESLPAIFSSAVLPHEIIAYSATLDLIRQQNWRRKKLHHNADYLRSGLHRLGYNVTASQSQIIALEAGSEIQTIMLRDALEAKGIFGAVFCAPATAKNRALIRFSVHSHLNQQQLNKVITVCADIREQVAMESWASTKRIQRYSMAA